jgi:hypothetical protein
VRIPPEALIDGCVETLQKHVLPALGSRFARGQLYTVLDVLRNLRDRVEPRIALFEAETESAAGALARAAEALRGGSRDAIAAADAIDALLAASPSAPPAARRQSLDDALVVALDRIDALAEGPAEAARAALGGHLAAQAIRDLATLKPSLLEEISRG